MKNFEKYSKENVQFFSDLNLPLLEDSIRESNPKRLIDLGCGDGAVLSGLQKKGLLTGRDVYGCDLSQERLDRLHGSLLFVNLVHGNAVNLTQFKDGYFDFIICSQVIEHLEDDEVLLKEIRRLLNRGGRLYISSVVKKWYGWWIYKNNGKVVCDPTHVREYASKEVFEELLINNGFKPVKVEVSRFKPSLVNAVGRVLCRLRLTTKEAMDGLYAKSRTFNRMSRMLSIPAPGYFTIEVVAKKSWLTDGTPAPLQ